MRKVTLFVAVLSFLFVTTACSNVSDPKTSGSIPANSDQTTTNAARGGSGQAAGDRTRRPDFGQPQRQSDVRGIVKSIIGNEVVILKIANQNRRASTTPDGAAGGSTSPNSARLALGAAGGGQGGGGGRGMGGFGGPGGGGPGGGQGANRAAMLEQLKKMSTGEDKIIIPVGIKMMKSSSDSSGKRTMVEAALTDVSADKSLTIWLNAGVTDKKVAEFVLIN